jgi:hypothetical protein
MLAIAGIGAVVSTHETRDAALAQLS